MELQRPERSHKHQPGLYRETSVPNQLSLPRTNDDIANPERAAARQWFLLSPTPFETAPVSPLPCSLPFILSRKQTEIRNQPPAQRTYGPAGGQKSEVAEASGWSRKVCFTPEKLPTWVIVAAR